MDVDYDVAVIGGGPVGLGLALDLGRRGISCLLVERHDAPQPIPKGQNLTQRTMEHLRSWGVEDAVRAARVMPPDAPTGGVTAYGSLLGPYNFDWWQRAAVRPYYYADNERLPQYRTEAVLRAAVSEQPMVTARFGWTADALVAASDSAAFEVRPTGGGPADTVSARFVVGCDGSRSAVRRLAGIHERRADHDRTMALLVFRSTELNRLLDHHRHSSFFKVLHPSFDGYWQFLGRVDADEQWFFHAPVETDRNPTADEAARLVHQAVGAAFALDVDHIGRWDLRTAWAATFRAGPVFVAGDAAHSHPPYGGFGINLGLEDARNLGWKLAARVAGWGGDGLLDSYDAERRPVFESTSEEFIEGSISRDRAFVRRFDPQVDRHAFEQEWERQQTASNVGVGGFEPNYEGSPIITGAPPGSTPGAVGTHTFEAKPGHHLPPSRLSSGATIDTELGPGFTLVALGAAGAVERFRLAARRLGVPLSVIVDSDRHERARYGAELILVRPDHFVAWAGRPIDDAEPVLRRAIGG